MLHEVPIDQSPKRSAMCNRRHTSNGITGDFLHFLGPRQPRLGGTKEPRQRAGLNRAIT
jgi:hypothetical protein